MLQSWKRGAGREEQEGQGTGRKSNAIDSISAILDVWFRSIRKQVIQNAIRANCAEGEDERGHQVVRQYCRACPKVCASMAVIT